MQLVARRVLTDCKKAWEFLDAETDQDRYRILWVSELALLRAVGHVLGKVDSKQSAEAKIAIDALYNSWKTNSKDHAIFWEFIEEERNLVLKEYELRYGDRATLVVNTASGTNAFELGDNLFCPMLDGPFAGQDGRDVIETAISWWESQLAIVDKRLGEAGIC